MDPQAVWPAIAAVAFSAAAFVVVFAFHITERSLMGINEELFAVKAALAEASSEIVGKISELESQIVATETVDPALLDEVKSLATGLANIVPNAVESVEDSPVVDDVEDGEVPVGEVPEVPHGKAFQRPELPADDAPTA